MPFESFNPDFSSPKRRSRAKRHLAWEQNDLRCQGFYSQHLQIILGYCPTLTPMESRVAALASGLIPSWQIGQILGIGEHAVENHRCRIRRKLGLAKEVHLTPFLQQVILAQLRKSHD